MIPLNNNFRETNLPEHPTFVVKKGELYLEKDKPSLLVHLWRKLTGQYSETKIVNALTRLSQNAFNDPDSPEILGRVISQITSELPKKKMSSLKDQLDQIKATLPRLREREITKLETSEKGVEWEAAIKKGKDPGSSETLRDNLDESLSRCSGKPAGLSDPFDVIDLIVEDKSVVISQPTPEINELLAIVGLRTVKDCIKAGIGPDIDDFKAYFDENRDDLTQILFEKGIIKEQSALDKMRAQREQSSSDE